LKVENVKGGGTILKVKGPEIQTRGDTAFNNGTQNYWACATPTNLLWKREVLHNFWNWRKMGVWEWSSQLQEERRGSVLSSFLIQKMHFQTYFS